jgi:hypothetical protein
MRGVAQEPLGLVGEPGERHADDQQRDRQQHDRAREGDEAEEELDHTPVIGSSSAG